MFTFSTSDDPEVRHSNTEESVLYYIRKYHNDFTLLQWRFGTKKRISLYIFFNLEINVLLKK